MRRSPTGGISLAAPWSRPSTGLLAAAALIVFVSLVPPALAERFGATPPRSAPPLMSVVEVRLWTSVPTSRVFLTLAHDAEVEIDVYDIRGRVVLRERRTVPVAGTHDITPQFRPASGVYFLRVSAGDFRASARWVVMR